MEQHLRGSQSPIDVFKYRRRQLSPLAPLHNLITPQTEDGVSVAESYGSKGQFVYGKENLHPTSFPTKNKSEAQMCEATSSSGLCTPSLKSHFAYQVMASREAAAVAALASSPKLNNTIETPITVISCKDWSPQDDGIEVILPSTEIPSSKEDVDASGTALLSLVYGPSTRRRRLPLFAEICPE
ncbi:uncharacterized protein LOC133707357 [Rosa rugosa]|uniref:uncharacterized protein LOC133707357 n=1 Tax=Rosa rugosa TaxID=74645 RepID=UPI002B4172B5|nr:uncharacterized protein LOC133707357 [Rosa rugosa]XP_061988897.1 uncharacterized protein LOC133707357 [Rosa rugosa]XP_061988898.1 uncharacterized protein LOC133707357 [Rosa rugosa]